MLKSVQEIIWKFIKIIMYESNIKCFLELAELASRIGNVVESSKKDGSAVAALKDSLDSAQTIIAALGKGKLKF